MRFDDRTITIAMIGTALFVSAGCAETSTDPARDALMPAEGGGADGDSVDGIASDATGSGGSDPDAEAPPCAPANVAGFQPPVYANVAPFPAGLPCSAYDGGSALVQAYGDACLGHAASYDACQALEVPDAGPAADCYHCLVTAEDTSGSTSAAVVFAVYSVVDYPACILAADPSDAGAACASALYTAAVCAEYACRPSCPVDGGSTRAAYENCTNEASSGPCAGYYVLAAECVIQEQANPDVSAICFAGSFTEDHYLAIAHHFCGGS